MEMNAQILCSGDVNCTPSKSHLILFISSVVFRFIELVVYYMDMLTVNVYSQDLDVTALSG